MNREITRFVNHMGGNTKASTVIGCSPDMVRKMKKGLRSFKFEHVQNMYRHRGFTLNFRALYDLD